MTNLEFSVGFLKSIKDIKQARTMRRLLNWYGPYLGAGVKIEYIADDWREVRVAMHMKWFNRNAVGTHFGGSLYAMVDPHYMLMLMRLLGNGYIVWDKSAYIDFIKPGKGTVRATMKITEQMLQDVYKNTEDGDKYLPEFALDIVDGTGVIVAHVKKTLYVRKKRETTI